MDIVIFEKTEKGKRSRYTKDHIQKIQSVVPDAKVHVVSPDSPGSIIKSAAIVIASSSVDIPLDDMRNLSWIHATSAGVGPYIQRIEKRNDILLTNSSGVHPVPIAEHVFGLILSLSRKIAYSHRVQITQKKWVRSLEYDSIFELQGKTIGIVGYGRIGERIGLLAKAFGMRVLSYSTNKRKSDVIDISYTKKDLDIVIADSDIIVNCLPETEETRGLLTTEKFDMMKAHALFINIGRGGTVVEKDLVEALKHHVIAGAGLDVFEKEPLPQDSSLWDLENVIITPHVAGRTPKYTHRMIDIFCENLTEYSKNDRMPNLVNKEVGY